MASATGGERQGEPIRLADFMNQFEIYRRRRDWNRRNYLKCDRASARSRWCPLSGPHRFCQAVNRAGSAIPGRIEQNRQDVALLTSHLTTSGKLQTNQRRHGWYNRPVVVKR